MIKSSTVSPPGAFLIPHLHASSIRPLQTADLKFRKLSGRHQISSDGKHLIDGVAFGRPYLRQANRPAIKIPPRKRRRLTYEQDEDENSDLERQVVVHTGFDVTHEPSESSGDGDFLTDEEEDLSDEVQDLQNESQVSFEEDQQGMTGKAEYVATPDSPDYAERANKPRSRTVQGLGLRVPDFLTDETGRPYPEYSNPLLDLFSRAEPTEQLSDANTRKRRKRLEAEEQQQKESRKKIRKRGSRGSRHSLRANNKGVRFEDQEVITPATIRAPEGFTESDDDDSEYLDDALLELDESDKENATPRFRHSEAYEVTVIIF